MGGLFSEFNFGYAHIHKKKKRPVWKQPPVPVAPLEDYVTLKKPITTRSKAPNVGGTATQDLFRYSSKSAPSLSYGHHQSNNNLTSEEEGEGGGSSLDVLSKRQSQVVNKMKGRAMEVLLCENRNPQVEENASPVLDRLRLKKILYPS